MDRISNFLILGFVLIAALLAAPNADAQRDRLITGEIRTKHLKAGTITAAKVAYKAVTVTVTAASATVTTAADADLAGGVLLACTPSTNQDQFLDNAVLNANGGFTLTLAANATANNVFRCVALKPDAKGTT